MLFWKIPILVAKQYIPLTLVAVTYIYNYRYFLYQKRYQKINSGLFTLNIYKKAKGTALIITYMLISFIFTTGMSYWGRYLITGSI